MLLVFDEDHVFLICYDGYNIFIVILPSISLYIVYIYATIKASWKGINFAS